MPFETSNAASIEIDLDPRINLAQQQNNIRVIRLIEIYNAGGSALRDLQLLISCEPEFAPPVEICIDSLAAGDSCQIRDRDLDLSPDYLWRLTERLGGRLRLDLRDEHGALLASRDVAVELLARDQWAGLEQVPEMLAAFILPNDPYVDEILRNAAQVLDAWTQDSSLSGYQTGDPRRVKTMAAAIYVAIQQMALTYVNPPPTFEADGQRIRLPRRIASSRMGTCLDLSLLAAACLEQAGLHALVFIVDGHAFSGVWVGPETFSRSIETDCQRARKRLTSGSLVAFDPVLTTAKQAPDFIRAVREAKRYLEDDENFLCVLDVQRARIGQVKPLPEEANCLDDAPSPQRPPATPAGPMGSYPEPEEERPGEPPVPETPQTRVDRWKKKLLDMTLRNRLLSFKDTKKSLPIVCSDIARLEDLLSSGQTFRLEVLPPEFRDGDPRDARDFERRTGSEARTAVLHGMLGNGRLCVDLTEKSLIGQLTEIYRAARTALEEGGSNSLYLALGILDWYEKEQSDQCRRAPVLLLPVELTRKSVREGYSLKLTDDEPQVNVTLQEMLRRDHGITIDGLDPLPQDDTGIDVRAVLKAFRKAVRDIDRWEVREDVRLGLFTFSKHLMWRDLSDRLEDLLENPLVDHLVNRPTERYPDQGEFPRPDQLDRERLPVDCLCPLPADSSQLSAVYSAADGKTFVLEGPPGTGKSQTITNMIAQCLALGKTVLFVSEKMAALDVVYRRLKNVGLGEFCLELHSNKTKKLDVLRQLGDVLRVEDHGVDQEWAQQARRLEGYRDKLNRYVGLLHKPHACGYTPFRATSELIGLRDVPAVPVRWEALEEVDRGRLADLRDLVDRVETSGRVCGDLASNPWRHVRAQRWSLDLQGEVEGRLKRLEEARSRLTSARDDIAHTLGLPGEDASHRVLAAMRDIARLLLESPAPPLGILVSPDWELIKGRVEDWVRRGRNRDRLRDEIRQRYRPDVFVLPVEPLQAILWQASRSRWPASWWKRRKVWSSLKNHALSTKSPGAESMAKDLESIAMLQSEQRELEAASAEAREVLGSFWEEGEAHWDGVDTLRHWADRLRALVLELTGEDFNEAEYLREKWGKLASEGRALLKPEADIGQVLVEFIDALNEYLEQRDCFTSLLDLDADAAWGRDSDEAALERATRIIARWQGAVPGLRDWCHWMMRRSEAAAAGLEPLVLRYEQAGIQGHSLKNVLDRSYLEWWLKRIQAREPVLAEFSSHEHERDIMAFRDVDEKMMELARDVVRTRLLDRAPEAAGATRQSEFGILNHELQKRRRHKPVRRLFGEIPNLLPRLKPCLLMSPMSVAQYLSPRMPSFDLVVFDEASQIPVWDAVGAIARAKQAVIVGDPKQLPPTSFFERVGEDDDDNDNLEVEDLESVLNDCISAQIPYLKLDWHYRSRHETLIAFSNGKYYDNRLHIFPSPITDGIGVKWRHVADGIYDRGGSSTNRAEAEAVVAEVLGRVRGPSAAGESIGVVTFSKAQQDLIEDLLDKERTNDPELDALLEGSDGEFLFVKNLENVQGDERDVIVFSVCYGPDRHGRVYMNFGPLGRDGGERRLNVAITRARKELLVFSTLRADHIDLGRVRGQGARDLKHFLEYAERGIAALPELIDPGDGHDAFDSPFEQAVCEAIRRKGWTVATQVGCAGYRVDLAVVDPRAPGRYVLGVECDGATYHRSRTARDRDAIRESVLRGLGWEIARIWSSDWWVDPDAQVEKIDGLLHRLTSGPPPTTVPAKSPAPAEEKPRHLERRMIARAPGASAETATRRPRGTAVARNKPYTATRRTPRLGVQEDFHDAKSNGAIRKRIIEVVEEEGPIGGDLLSRRVSSCWGFDRASAKVKRRVRAIAARAVNRHEIAGDVSYWPADLDPGTYAEFRVPNHDPLGRRDLGDVPLPEMANAAFSLLKNCVSAPRREVARETARILGCERMGRIVEKRLNAAISILLDDGRASCDGSVIVVGKERAS